MTYGFTLGILGVKKKDVTKPKGIKNPFAVTVKYLRRDFFIYKLNKLDQSIIAIPGSVLCWGFVK